MALPDLAGMRTQVRALLIDAGSAIWTNDTLDQAFRQTLADLGRAYGFSATTGYPKIKDLDSASSTTIEEPDISVVVLGAAAYAAGSRVADLSEMHTMGDVVPSGLVNAATSYTMIFNSLLEVVRRRKLATSTSVPYTVMVEDADEDATMEWDE